jgi:hypothetical protein
MHSRVNQHKNNTDIKQINDIAYLSLFWEHIDIFDSQPKTEYRMPFMEKDRMPFPSCLVEDDISQPKYGAVLGDLGNPALGSQTIHWIAEK